MALTAKQRLFVAEYLIDLNATQAAIRAGYSARTAQEQGSRLLSNVMVDAAVKESMDKRAGRVGVTADYVLATIIETIERCKQAAPVLQRDGKPAMTETADGESVPAYQFDASAVLKGAELLGKHLKLFTDKTEHSGPNGGPIESKVTVEYVGVNANPDRKGV